MTVSELTWVIELVKSFGLVPALVIVIVLVLLRVLRMFEEKLEKQTTAIIELTNDIKDLVIEIRDMKAKLDTVITILLRNCERGEER